MHWFICIYYFVRNVHYTEQLRQLETRAAQSFSGAQGKFFGGDPSSPPPPTSPSTTFSFLSFLHGILVWYFAQKPEIFCQKFWATLLATTFFRLFNGLVVTVIPSLGLLEPLVFPLGVILVATVRCILNLFSCTPSVCSDGFADLLADCRCRPNALQEDLD